MSIEELRRISIFADLADDQLAWLAENCAEVRLQPGETLIEEGAPADSMLIVLAGEIHGRLEKGPPDGRIYIIKAGDVTGMLPFSRMTHYALTGRAVVPSRIARFPAALFPEMMRRIPVLEARLVGVLADRVREATRIEQQREKLMALGKLSAGLAHELNNPAAAARRSAGELRERLVTLRRLHATLLERGLAYDAAHAACELQERVEERAAEPAPDPLTLSDREEEMTAWMEQRGVPRAWELAGTFAAARLTADDLRGLGECDALPEALAWIEGELAADALAREVESSVRRISDLVGSVKSYSHMDSAQARGEVDLHKEIDSTLTMLAHKIRAKNANVVRAYAPDLPKVNAFAGELNQVWTNLLDNALDAIGPGGRIEVRTARENSHVRVDIRDDGPGIPPESQGRIWEAFFTNKPIGEGTGLGLDIAQRIVTRRHNGEISVTSVPGDTCFTVRLPI